LEQADRLRRTRRYALKLSDTFLPAAFLALFGDLDPGGAQTDVPPISAIKLQFCL
jgi:type I restriction enzyme S subunit